MEKDNEEDYQRVLFEMYYRKVYSIAHFIIKDAHLAQDIVQETFIKAFQYLNHLKEVDKFGAWIGTIVSRTAIDYLKKKQQWDDFNVKEEFIDIKAQDKFMDSPVEKILEVNEKKAIIRQEMEKMSPIDRKILILKYEYDLKNDEIASRLSISVEAVKSRLIRAKIKLKESLKNLLQIEDGVQK